MHQTAVAPYFLHVLNVDSGLWESTMLDMRVSPHLLEAMNAILVLDGINAFIGLRSEPGALSTELEKRHARVSPHCWHSLPASTVIARLELCQNMWRPEKPVMAFHGSPLVILLSIALADRTGEFVLKFRRHKLLGIGLTLRVEDQPYLDLPCVVYATHDELDEVLSYFDDIKERNL